MSREPNGTPLRPADFTPADFDLSLNLFDEPVRRFLESQIRDLGHNPDELRPVIDVALEEGKSLVGKEISPLLPPSIIRSRIEEGAYLSIQAILSQTRKWESAYERIRSYSSVFLTGAGISFESGVPLSKVLADLMMFCKADDWSELRRNNQKCLKFKSEFKSICDRKNPGVSHKLIAENFPEHILEIICLNWDSLIERAAQELGKAIPKENEDRHTSGERHLWKFHGDVENLERDNVRGKGGWVFPDEDGHVFNSFIRYVEETGLRGQLFVFVIAGYSEKEGNIYDKVISVFEAEPPRPTFRIGLDLARLREEHYIVGPSDFVLRKMLPLVFS